MAPEDITNTPEAAQTPGDGPAPTPEEEIEQLRAALAAESDRRLRSLLTIDKKHLTQKFFEEVAVQVRRAFERANKDAETWLRAIMAPMETQVREHQIQLCVSEPDCDEPAPGHD